ncbi:MAG TPA: helix-turn-helix domain-containing protein [Roseiflexaceae bacterium]|nr:helix-turn-helix domain-containing protein [Roseiflexaceae bacterium]
MTTTLDSQMRLRHSASPMPPITVRDTLRLALPSGTQVLGGEAGLAHQVTWTATPRATPPAFANLRGGELVLASVAALRALDEQLTPATLIERLATVPVAAVAFTGLSEGDAVAVANTTHIPLLMLPADADIREIEREVQRLINDYDVQLERRGAQLAAMLTQRSLAGGGLQGLVDVLAERTGGGVGCYSASGELRRFRARGPARVALQTLQPSASGTQVHLGKHMLVHQLGAGSDRLGFLVICNDTLDDWDRVAAQQGSAAVALELAKQQAVLAAEERLRGDFVQAVLSGQATDGEAVLQRGRELGYDLRQAHVALLCAPIGDGPDEAAMTRLASTMSQALNALGITVPTMRRIDSVLCFVPSEQRGQHAREFAEQLRLRIGAELPVAVAIGRDAPAISSWQRSLNEAEQALLIGRELLDTSRVLDFADLGVYRLLILLREKPELWDFYRTTLSALADYDRDQRAELLKTLQAFFEHLGNLARTAEALHVHRNTLLYRLERIRDISGMNLDDPDDRLALWLALKAHRVLLSLDRVS